MRTRKNFVPHGIHFQFTCHMAFEGLEDQIFSLRLLIVFHCVTAAELD